MFRCLVIASLVVCSLGAAPKLRRPRLDGGIVGTEDVDISDYPYQVSVERSGSYIAGASIISVNWVVTAAHIVDGLTASSTQFRAGSSIRGSGGTLHQAAELIVNPRYDYYTIDFDVAVARVSVSFTFGSTIQAIPLIVSEPAAGDTGVVTGWGSSSTQLQAVNVTIVSRPVCDAAYSSYGGITRNMFCATESGEDACQGDPGGPLAVGGTLAGITSWGVGCGQAGYPSVYSSVATLRDFITAQTGVS